MKCTGCCVQIAKGWCNHIIIPYSLYKQLGHLHGVHIVAPTIYTDCMSSEFVVSDIMLEGVTLYDTCIIVNA